MVFFKICCFHNTITLWWVAELAEHFPQLPCLLWSGGTDHLLFSCGEELNDAFKATLTITKSHKNSTYGVNLIKQTFTQGPRMGTSGIMNSKKRSVSVAKVHSWLTRIFLSVKDYRGNHERILPMTRHQADHFLQKILASEEKSVWLNYFFF